MKRFKNLICLFLAVICMAVLNSCVNTSQSALRSPLYEPNILTREGLALSRVVASPVNYVGFFCADCYDAGPVAGTILSPLILVKEVFGGTAAMTADILTGTVEMLTTLQFKSVSYPWESFDPQLSDKWFQIAAICVTTASAATETYAAVKNSGKGGGTAVYDGNSGGGSGYISGSTNVQCGKSYNYSLHVDGSTVTSGVAWSVSGGGTTMFGNRLSVSSKVSNGGCKITAKYNGRYYTKLIWVK